MTVSLKEAIDEQHAPVCFSDLLQEFPGKDFFHSCRNILALLLQVCT